MVLLSFFVIYGFIGDHAGLLRESNGSRYGDLRACPCVDILAVVADGRALARDHGDPLGPARGLLLRRDVRGGLHAFSILLRARAFVVLIDQVWRRPKNKRDNRVEGISPRIQVKMVTGGQR